MFRSELKKRLNNGDKEAQEFNRTHVIALGQFVQTAIFSNLDKPDE